MVDLEDCCRVRGHGLECTVFCQTFTNRDDDEIPQRVNRVDGRVGHDRHRGTRLDHDPNRCSRAPVHLTLGCCRVQRADSDGNPSGHDLVGDAPPLGRVFDDEPVPEFLRETDSGADVVHPMCVVPYGDLAVEDQQKCLHAEVAFRLAQRFPILIRLGVFDRLQRRVVVPVLAILDGIEERLPHQVRRSHPGARRAAQVLSHAFRVLPERHFHTGRFADHHVVGDEAERLDDGHLPADGISRPVGDPECRYAAAPGILEPDVLRVDGIEHPHVRSDGIGDLVGVMIVPRPFAPHSGVHVCIDETREEIFSDTVHDLSTGCVNLGADSNYLPTLDEERPSLDGISGGGPDRGVGIGVSHGVHGSAGV